jgi:tetratricopeptide (TPR) repeat protein
VEYGFRHALVREACRGLLGEEELALGHARAAAFLESQGFEDPAVLAEHWQRGGEPSRARMLHLRAARAAFETNDLEGILAHAAQAQALGAEGTELGLVHAMTAYALFWNRDWVRSCEVGLAALPLLPRGSSWSCRVLGLICQITSVGIRAELFPAHFDELVATNPDVEATSAYAESIGRVLSFAAARLDRACSQRAHARLTETLDMRGAVDATAHGWARFAMYSYGRVWTHEPSGLVFTIEDAARAFEESGDERMHAVTLGHVGDALSALGQIEQAEARLREATSIAAAIGERYASVSTRLLLATHLGTRPEPEKLAEARAIALSLLSEGRLDPFDGLHARGLVARVALAEGEHEEALWHADLALEAPPYFGVWRLSTQATRIRVLARLGRVAEAASYAGEVLAKLAGGGIETVGAWDVYLHTATAEAFRLAGRMESFEVELRAALSALAQGLADIAEPEESARFLRDVPENALAVRMSREHFGADFPMD